jgi:RNA-directed DNA polymerase
MNLLSQDLKRTIESGSLFTDVKQAISSDCWLIPVISSYYLVQLDKERLGKLVYFQGYLANILVLSPSRWKLRKAIKTINRPF